MQHNPSIRIIACLGLLMVSLVSVGSDTLFAQSSNDIHASVQQLNAQTQALEKQMQALQVQLRQLKQQQAQLMSKTMPFTKASRSAKKSSQSKTRRHDTQTHAISPHSQHHGKETKDVLRSNPHGALGSQLKTTQHATRWLDIRGTTVVTSPYFGPQPQFDGSDMLVNTSSVNKDLVLLQMRQSINKQFSDAQKPPEAYSVITLSGELEGAAKLSNGFDNQTVSDLNLTGAELDIGALVYPWVLGYLTFEYDSGSLPNVISDHGQRERNSNLQLGQGFFTIGDLNRTPVYFTLGQLYAPFGQYSSYMYSDSLPKTLGRAKVRAAVLGFNGITRGNGLYSSIYAFSGDSHVSSKRNIDQGGFNVGYRYRRGGLKSNTSVSIISNMADSSGMQTNGVDSDSQFSGFGHSSSTERLKHRVPGIDTQANVSYGSFTLIGDYITAMRSFDKRDMTYNGRGARPNAMHVEGAYNFAFYNRPGSFAVGYDHSWQALALNVPRNRFATALNYSIWRNTLASFEYRYDINYRNHDTAGGIINGSSQTLLTPEGRTSNNFTLVLDYFF